MTRYWRRGNFSETSSGTYRVRPRSYVYDEAASRRWTSYYSDNCIITENGDYIITETNDLTPLFLTLGFIPPSLIVLDKNMNLDYNIIRTNYSGVFSAVVQDKSSGGIYLGGDSGTTSYDGTTVKGAILRLHPNLEHDTSFTLNASHTSSYVTHLGVFSDGRVLAVNSFHTPTVSGVAHPSGVYIFHPNGELDSSFYISGANQFGLVKDAWVTRYDSIFVRGIYFSDSNEQTHKFHPNGAVDSSFPGIGQQSFAYGDVIELVNGDFVFGGGLSTFGGSAIPTGKTIIKTDANFQIDTSFSPNATATVTSLKQIDEERAVFYDTNRNVVRVISLVDGSDLNVFTASNIAHIAANTSSFVMGSGPITGYPDPYDIGLSPNGNYYRKVVFDNKEVFHQTSSDPNSLHEVHLSVSSDAATDIDISFPYYNDADETTLKVSLSGPTESLKVIDGVTISAKGNVPAKLRAVCSNASANVFITGHVNILE